MIFFFHVQLTPMANYCLQSTLLFCEFCMTVADRTCNLTKWLSAARSSHCYYQSWSLSALPLQPRQPAEQISRSRSAANAQVWVTLENLSHLNGGDERPPHRKNSRHRALSEGWETGGKQWSDGPTTAWTSSTLSDPSAHSWYQFLVSTGR